MSTKKAYILISLYYLMNLFKTLAIFVLNYILIKIIL